MRHCTRFLTLWRNQVRSGTRQVQILMFAPEVAAAVVVAQGTGKTAVVVVEDDSVPFVHHSRIRKEFCYHAGKNDHRRRISKETV